MAEGRKVAIVTGGNRGMGLETCRQLGRRGYYVVMTARDRALGEAAATALRERDGIAVEVFRLDMTRPEDIAALVMHARRSFVRVDVLVNNAGLYLELSGSTVNDWTSVFDSQMELMRAILQINLLGPFALSQGIVSIMRDQGYGRVVNISSGMGQLAEMGGGSPGYRIAGAGTNAMTRMFAQELTGTNVLVNSVCPGWVQTNWPEAQRTVEDGVDTTIWLATLPDGGPTGQFFRDRQPIPW